MSLEYLKSLSPLFLMSRNFPLEKRRGVQQQRVLRKRGVRIKRTCAYEGGEGVKFYPFWSVRTN